MSTTLLYLVAGILAILAFLYATICRFFNWYVQMQCRKYEQMERLIDDLDCFETRLEEIVDNLKG